MRARTFFTAAALVIVFPGIAGKSENRGRIYAFETAALKAIQTLNTAEVEYNSMFGRFAVSLSELGPAGANLIAGDLAAGEKLGYRFTLAPRPEGYAVAAVPSAYGTALRRFDSDQSLVIRESRYRPSGEIKP